MPTLTRSTIVPSHSFNYVGTGFGSFPTSYSSASLTYPSYQSVAGELYTEYGKKTDHLCSNYQKETSHTLAKPTFCTTTFGSDSVINYVKWTGYEAGVIWNSTTQNPSFGFDGLGGLNSLSVSESTFVPFVDDAVFNLLPGIKPSMSLLNSLFELKDFRKLPELVSRFKFAASTLRKLKSTRARGKKQTLKMITGLGADAYLTNQFAIQPLLGDLESIVDALTGYKKEVERLLRDEGKIRKAHWVKPCASETNLLPLEQQYTSGAVLQGRYLGDKVRRSVTYVVEPTFRAQLVYRYNLRGFEREYAHLWGAMDALGLNLNPAHIWNAIPFSFIVDWVVKVGDTLDRKQMRNIEPITDILRFSWSFKVNQKVEMFTHRSIGGPVDDGEVKTGETTEAFYYRKPGIPSYDRLLQVSGLNLKEMTLGTAMVGGKWARS